MADSANSGPTPISLEKLQARFKPSAVGTCQEKCVTLYFICQKEQYFHLPPHVDCPDALSIEARVNTSLLASHGEAHMLCLSGVLTSLAKFSLSFQGHLTMMS